ncbi:MAG: thioredoxin family protein [Thermotogota bacterium]
MKKYIMIIFSFILISLSFSNFSEVAINDFDDAFKIARITDKKILLMFSTDSCKYCRIFKEETMQNEELKKWFQTEFILVEIKPKMNKKTTFKGKEYTYLQLFGVFSARTTPSFVYLNKTGEVLGSFKGLYEDEIYIKLSQYMAYENKEEVSLKEFLKSKNNYEIKKKVIEITDDEAKKLLEIDPNVTKENNGNPYKNLITSNKNEDSFLILFVK